MPTSKDSKAPAGGSEKALCLLTPDGTILTCNSATLSFLGKDNDEVVEHRCHEVFGCPAPMENGCPLAKTLKSHRKASSRIHRHGCRIDEVADPLFDASGLMSGVMLSVAGSPTTAAGTPDLVRLARLTAIAQATSGVVHDFNNIFARISGAAYLLKVKLSENARDPNHAALMDSIEGAIEQGTMLTAHLLEFGKGHELDHSVFVLTAVIEKAVSFSVIGQAIRPSVSIQTDLWPVKANAGQITQLISNLTINALHASGKDKPIRITAENLSDQAARDAGLEPRKYVRITVQDEGHGIPPDQLDHLFEPFFTTKKNGTGLGLATAHLIVKDHGGHIGVTSEVGRGTTFTIHLPAVEPAREKTPA